MQEKYRRIIGSSVLSFCVFVLCLKFLGISNIKSYIIFIVVLISSYWLIESYLEKINISKRSIAMHIGLAVITWVACMGVLSSETWYNIALIVLSTRNPLTLSLEALGVVIFYFLLKKICDKLSIWALIIPLTIVSIWLYLSSNYFDIHHHAAIFISISKIMNGIPFSTDMQSIYGHYAFFFKPLFEIIPLTRENFDILFALLVGIAFLNFSSVLNYLIKDKFYKHLGILLLFGFITMPPRGYSIYLAITPLRVIFPSILLVWATYFSRKNRILYWLCGLLISTLSIIFNPETGLVCLVSFAAFYGYERSFSSSNIIRIVGECLSILFLGMIGALCLYNIFNLSLGGDLQNISDMLYPLLAKNNVINFMQIPLVLTEYFWVLAIIIFSCCILYALNKNPLFIKNKPQSLVSYHQDTGIVFITAILGILALSYYMSRTIVRHGLIVSSYITILTIWILSSIKTPKYPEKIDIIFLQALKNVGTISVIFAIVSIFSDAIYSKKFHDYISQKNKPNPTLEIHKKFVQEHMVNPKQTIGFGSDIWEYAFLDLGYQNNLAISDLSDFSFTYFNNINRPIDILTEKKAKYLFIKTLPVGWFYLLPEMGEILPQALDSLLASSYKLVAEDTENDMRFYERIE